MECDALEHVQVFSKFITDRIQVNGLQATLHIELDEMKEAE